MSTSEMEQHSVHANEASIFFEIEKHKNTYAYENISSNCD